MTYEQSVHYLFSLLSSIRKESFGLDRMGRLVAELGDPHRGPGIIHIAGTNGKGSTAAMIEAGILAAGHSTGLYTSPHLTRINERFRVDGISAPDEALADAIERVRRANEALVARYGRSSHPTFFESTTAVALVLFREANLDYRIVETGLGGRLDASNVVEPQFSVITRIAFDHEGILGGTLAEIAAEKAAIIKRGSTAVIGNQEESARQVLGRRARDVDAVLIDASQTWRAENVRAQDGCAAFEATGEGRSIPVKLSLAGNHQVENAITAIAALDEVGISEEEVFKGLKSVSWPGRLEVVKSEPRVVLDAAHNPSGARSLAGFLDRHRNGSDVTLIYGSSREKAVDEIAAWLFPRASRVIVTQANVQRSLRPKAIASIAGHHNDVIESAETIREALDRARSHANPADWIVVSGSIFLVGEAREALGCE